MKKNLFFLVSLASLVGLVSMTSCKKEETLGNGTQFRATMEACTSQDGKTVLNGTALEWVSTDQIAIYGTAGAGIYTATPQTPATVAVFDNVSGETGNAPFRAFYPTTLTTDGVNITLPTAQTYVEGSINEFPMYAESSDNELAFKNLCGVLKLHLTKANTNISTITITAASETMINGTFSVSYNGGDPDLIYSANGTNTTALECATPQSITEGKDFYIYLPEGNYNGLQIQMNTDDGRYCVKTANTAINVARSQYTLITLGSTLEFRPIGSKGGLFTINANGDQVRFSQGNLLYKAGTNTWRFAENQFDIVGDATIGNIYEGGIKCNNNLRGATYNGWIDLFSWGTSGWNSGRNHYMPYDCGGYYLDHIVGGGLTDSYVEADWAWHNAISNGGNAIHHWRTLTAAEYLYLFNTRANTTNLSTANARYAKSNVNGVYGVILFPDNYVHPSVVTPPTGINSTSNSGWDNNNYSLPQWTKMEEAGAVFLPAAGYYTEGGTLVNVGSQGYYWTTTVYNTSHAHCISFTRNEFHSWRGYYKNCCYSVRPVCDNN